MKKHIPKGPGGTWMAGQRAPEDGWWRNQYGDIIHMERGSTFPPRVGFVTRSQAAYWESYSPAATGSI